MMPTKNLPLLLNLSYYGFNRALRSPSGQRGDFEPIFNTDGSVQTTFCNQFIQYIASGYGYDDFDGMNANEMFDFMGKPENGWVVVDDAVAQAHANSGVLVLAAHAVRGAHGHVCLILPGVLEKSSSWARSVPKCTNVGKDVFYGKKVSFAFTLKEMPTFFALGSMV